MTVPVANMKKDATSKFLQENPEGVRIAENVREIAEKAVSNFFLDTDIAFL